MCFENLPEHIDSNTLAQLRKPFIDLSSVPASQFKPARGRVLVQRIDSPDSGPIAVVQTYDQKRRTRSRARVVSCGLPPIDEGHAARPDAMPSPGDIVVIDRLCGHDMLFADESGKTAKYAVIVCDEILGIVD
ncbi:hypothetical protein UFOVP329_9 [uncultured Caudovirales phage]|uniref:Uncharacterized protein n=1 Tax=uncultured Caudovirales phage TaxID=2100421 RepID=A0A6J5LYV9_9CAUD|nr:hypothetical protein UFOVP329_9 [uncultured Caudovirales phage]